MSLYPVINQVTGVIGELDVDDCAPTATIWAAKAADSQRRTPTIPEFRRAAGNPDDPYHADGLTNGQLAQAVPIIWPGADHMRLDTKSWTAFMDYLDRGQSASVAVNSAHLPSSLRFGFYGNHRVGVQKPDGVIYMANPLAPNGSRPIAISEPALKYAMGSLIRAEGWYLAITFPPVAHLTPTPKEGNVAIRYATVTDTASHMALARGQRVYDAPGGDVLAVMSVAKSVPHIGLAGSIDGHAWRAVLVSTGRGYADGEPRPTIGYVPSRAGKVTPDPGE